MGFIRREGEGRGARGGGGDVDKRGGGAQGAHAAPPMQRGRVRARARKERGVLLEGAAIVYSRGGLCLFRGEGRERARKPPGVATRATWSPHWPHLRGEERAHAQSKRRRQRAGRGAAFIGWRARPGRLALPAAPVNPQAQQARAPSARRRSMRPSLHARARHDEGGRRRRERRRAGGFIRKEGEGGNTRSDKWVCRGGAKEAGASFICVCVFLCVLKQGDEVVVGDSS